MIDCCRLASGDALPRRGSPPVPAPNPYEDASCQETNASSERFWPFFPLSRAWRSRQAVAWLTCLLGAGANPAWRHPTRMAALSPPRGGWQSTVRARLCGRAMMRCPRTGLCTGMAAPLRLARACQARERGRARPLGRRAPLAQEPAWRSKPSPGRWDTRPLRPLACRAAGTEDVVHARSRLLPWVASAASGSPPLLPALWRTLALCKAVWCLRIAETARASGWARSVTACPWACVFPSGRARFGLPAWCAGTTRRPRKRPTGGGRSRVVCRTCPRVGPPMPWHTGPDGTRRRHPAPAARGPGRAGRRAARG
jgi:hypothetical protein